MGERIDRWKKIVANNENYEQVKTHIEKYKVFYALAGGAIASAGITAIIMRSNAARGAAGGVEPRGGSYNTASYIYGKKHTINVTTVLDREGRGHPGWPVRNLETKQIFLSQKDAANKFGIPQNVLSAHIHGKFPDVDGLHFERVNLQPS